jgi:hypothetical protein
VDKQIRVHLIDIDSPGQAIHQHLSQLKDRIGTSARSLEIPGEEELSAKGIDTANGLAALTTDTAILGGLRTIRQSLIAYKDGFRVHIGPIEGNAAHPAREEAITANLLDVLRTAQPGSVLGLYGSIHVRRGSLNLPDPAKGGTFHHFPMAGRLEKTGVEVYKLCSEPLSGPLFWRLNYFEFPSDRAEQFRLNGGETLGDILQKAPDFEFIHFDFAKGIRLSTESEDYSEQFDACVFFRKITPMENLCSPPSK